MQVIRNKYTSERCVSTNNVISSLELQNKRFIRSDFISKFISMNKQKMKKLSFINIVSKDCMQDMFDYLKKDQPKIESITFRDCKKFAEDEVGFIIKEMKTINSLEEVNLEEMGICCQVHQEKKVHVDLEHLNKLETQVPLTETLYYTFRDHKNLRVLNLSNNKIVDFNYIHRLVENTRILEHINL